MFEVRYLDEPYRPPVWAAEDAVCWEKKQDG